MSVPVTTAMQNSIANLYIAILGRNPEPAGFAYWVDQYANNNATQTALNSIAMGFGKSPEFIGTYGGRPTQDAVALMYQNVLNRAPDAPGLAYWTNYANGLINGSTPYTIGEALALTGNALIVAAAANTGTADATLIATKQAAAVASGTAAPTTTYTLTTSIETINVTQANSSVVGYATTGTATGDTFQAADTINGMAGGNTTINLTAAGTIAATPLITNVANLNVRAATTSSMAADAGYSTITSSNSSAAMTFSGIKSAATLGVINGGNNNTSFTYASNALRSATASQSMVFGGVGDTSTRPTITLATAGTDVIKTVNIAATGFNAITTENTNASTNAWVSAETISISGSGSMRIVGASNTLKNVTTINASTNTGGVNIDLATGANALAVSFTGGSGNDRVSFAAGNFDINDVLVMGSGTNTLALGDATISTAATPNLVSAIKAVSGLTTLELTYATPSSTGALSFNANNIGLSSYTISGAITGTAGAAASASTAIGSNGVAAVTVSGELNTQSFTISASQTGGVGGAGSGAGTGSGGGAGASAVVFAPNLDNGSNALTLTLGSAATGAGVTLTGGAGGAAGTASAVAGGNGAAALDASSFETVNLTAVGGSLSFVGGSGGASGSAAAAGSAGAGLAVGTNATVNISGLQDVTLGVVTGSNVTISTASGFSNNLSVATVSGNTSVTSGSGNDTVIFTAAATGTANTGAGNDTVVIVGASTYVTTANAITATAGVTVAATGADYHGDVVTLGGGTDTIKFMADGFVNMLQTSAGTTRIVSIRDFVVGADKIALVDIGGSNSSIVFGASSTIASADTLAQVYAGITAIAASTDGGALSASLVTVNGGARAGTYLYVNNATDAVASADDMLVNITGITGTLSSSDFIFA